jgi:hypothetical protein
MVSFHRNHLYLKVVDVSLGVFKKTEKDHVLEAGSHQGNGQTLVHARPRYGHRRFADFLCSAK